MEEFKRSNEGSKEEIRERETQVKVACKVEALQQMVLEKETTEERLYDLKKKLSSLKKLETLAKLPKAK